MWLACVYVTHLAPAEAHMASYWPCPRGSPAPECSKYYDYRTAEYNIEAPLNAAGGLAAKFPCRTKSGRIVGTYKAGSELTMKFRGGANHDGGHCQFALSYNGGPFAVIATRFDDCMKNLNARGEYDETILIPKDAPTGQAVLLWMWNNALGNRELYTTCTPMKIDGASPEGYLTGLAPAILQLPGYPQLPEWRSHPKEGNGDGRLIFEKRPVVQISPTQAARRVKGKIGGARHVNTLPLK